jgi:hypothetical protein
MAGLTFIAFIKLKTLGTRQQMESSMESARRNPKLTLFIHGS